MDENTGTKRYGVVNPDAQAAMGGLEFVQGLVSGSLPLNSMARTLGYDIVEASSGRVVVTAFPTGDHLNPAGTVHGGLAVEPGQEKKDRTITAGDGRVSAVASMEKSFDVFRREIFWQLSEPPCRHRRHGPCEITFGLSVLKQKSAEGAQSRHHQLGNSWTTRASVPLDETGDVLGDQLSNADG
jgi:hypothetical protein